MASLRLLLHCYVLLCLLFTGTAQMQEICLVLEALQRKILKLRAGNETADGYKMLIEGGDPRNACMDHQVYEIWQRCAILCAAYVFEEEQMYNGTTWKSCCHQSCSHLNMCGIKQTTDWKVLERWNIAFRLKECFNHPNRHVAIGKVPEPLLFEAYLWIKCHICNFCLGDLANLNIEKVRAYILSIAIP